MPRLSPAPTMSGAVRTAGSARVGDIVARLRERGHRLTPQRLAVVEALVSSGDHPSVEQVYARVRQAHPMMSPATVYKTIDTLKSAGEVLELEFRDGPNRYDAAMATPHPHLICTHCGQIQDAPPGVDITALVTDPQPSGFQPSHFRLDIFGLCQGCQAAG